MTELFADTPRTRLRAATALDQSARRQVLDGL